MIPTLVAFVALTLAPVWSPVASLPAAEGVPAERVDLRLTSATGSGCPSATTWAGMFVDSSRFEVGFDQYIAAVGVGATAVAARRSCEVAVEIIAPVGYTYAVRSTEYVGMAGLAPGAHATVRGSAAPAGQAGPPQVTHRVDGPYDGAWRITDPVDEAALAWAPCGGAVELRLRTAVQAYPGDSDPATTTSYLSLTGECFAAATTYHLAWRHC